MNNKDLFKNNQSSIERTYANYNAKYNGYKTQRTAILHLINDNFKDKSLKLSIGTKKELQDQLIYLNQALDDLHEILDDIAFIYKYYGYKEERSRRKN